MTMTTLQEVARRVVWFDSPEQTLSNPPLFLAHLMVYGTLEEVLAVKQHFTDRDFQNVLDNPPAGIFDPRSWAYWNLVFGNQPSTPLPVARRFPASDGCKDTGMKEEISDK